MILDLEVMTWGMLHRMPTSRRALHIYDLYEWSVIVRICTIVRPYVSP